MRHSITNKLNGIERLWNGRIAPNIQNRLKWCEMYVLMFKNPLNLEPRCLYTCMEWENKK